MATVTVRQATPDNAAELARLLDLFDTVGATPEQVAARMLACQNVLWIFLGDLDGQPVGFACLRLIPHLQGDDPYAELTDIYVDAPFRRQDVACGLIAHVEAAARAAGARAVLRRLRRRLRVPVLPQPRRLDAPSGEQGPPNIPLRADRSDPPNLARPQHRRADGGAVDAACWRVVVWSRRALSTGDTDAGSQGRIYRVDQSKGEQRWCRPLSADATTRRPLAARRPRCGAGWIVGPLGVADVEGLALLDGGALYVSTGDKDAGSQGRIYRVDQSTGGTTLASTFVGGRDYEAIAGRAQTEMPIDG